MTPQEQQMLQDLATRINQTSLPEKDSEAEQYLSQTLGRNPDALYILAQTVLVQQYALDQAKKQMSAQSQPSVPPPPQKHTSFLGSLLGRNDDSTQQSVAYQPVPGAPAPQYGNTYGGQPQYVQPGSLQQGYAQPTQGGGFLRGAMQTAAGVAAGAFAFQGIESLMSGFGHHAGYGSNFGDLGGGTAREEVVNNYYGDSGNRERGGYESRDVEDRRDDPSFGDRLEAADSTDNNQDDSSSDDTSDNYDPGGTDNSF